MAEDLDLLNLEPLYADQDELTILARWREWANEGLDPAENADEWVDTREGSHWWISNRGAIREAARIYDLMGTELLAAGFPQWSWGEYLDDHAELRNLARLAATPAEGEVTFTGANGTTIFAGTGVGVEPADPGAAAPEFQTLEDVVIAAGTATVPVRATEGGSAGNVSAGAITAILTPVDATEVEAVTNASPTEGGTDTETDGPLRTRTLETFVGIAVANQLYYRRLALNYPGIGRVTVLPVAGGAGTLTIVIATAGGDPVSGSTLAGFQEEVDPVPGQGAGEGQTGATITVATAATLDVNVAATVEYEPGYSEDGAGNTIAMADPIEAVLAAYINSVESGSEVVRARALAKIVNLTGIHDVTVLTLSPGADGDGNVPVPSAPPKVPTLGTLTLS